MNLYEQQSANRRRTWLIMLAFVAVLFFLGLGFDAFYMGTTGGYVPIGSVMALGVGAWTAAVFHLFTHAFFKADLFLGAGSVSHSGSHHSFDMKTDMGGPKASVEPREAARTALFLASRPLSDQTGLFWRDCEVIDW